MRTRFVGWLCLGAVCVAQAIAQDAPKPEAAKPAETPASPVSDKNVSVQVDFGGRFLHTLEGSSEAYRSIVNLGEGMKLFGLEMQITGAGSRLFDRMDLSAHGWGGDPYNTLRVTMEKSRAYRLTGDYRNMSYHNFLPSYGNPFLQAGSLNTERAFDTQRRYANVEVEFAPAGRAVPYLAYTRDSGAGSGVTPFQTTSNEYPVVADLRDGTNQYRAGIRFEFRTVHMTLEGGKASFEDGQRNSFAGNNPGNRTTPLLGEQLVLTALDQAYNVRGRNQYGKAILTGAPAPWMDYYAQFLYSRPTSTVTYTDDGKGLFFLAPSTFYTGLQTAGNSEAKMPRTTGSAGVELRPVSRIRITQGFSTDRYHDAASLLLAQTLLFPADPAEASRLLSGARMSVDYSRIEGNVFYDPASWLTLRGGFRYAWGNATLPPNFLTPDTPDHGELRRPVALAGLTLRRGSKISANVDYEGSPGDQEYFRTSLHTAHSVHARARWQLLPSLLLSASALFLDNQNPEPGSGYDFRSRATSASLQWRPKDGKKIALLAEYTRSTVRSDITYLVPQTLTPARSFYFENAHTAAGLVEWNPLGAGVRRPFLSAGGSLYVSSGSRPTDFWQPVGRVGLPIRKQVEVYGEWRWYDFAEALYLAEGFRSHQFVAGLRLSK